MRIFLLCFVLLCLVACETEAPAPTPTQVRTPTATLRSEIGIDLATRAAPTQAVVQITPSPLPSATPTPTPTPIVYAVQDGDTVWSIAYSNGTNPDNLLALNPALNPALLGIGDTLVLPPRPTPLAQTVLGTRVPLAVDVLSLQIYRTASGAAWLLGEVENLGLASAENVQLQIDLGSNLGQLTTWVATQLILPGERAPFGLLLRDFSAEIDNISASVIGGNSVTALGSRNVNLNFSDVSLDTNGPQVTLSGVISNSNPLTSTASIIATLYDATGQVSGFAQTELVQSLGGGNSAEFSITTNAPGPPVVAFNISALGLLLGQLEQNE